MTPQEHLTLIQKEERLISIQSAIKTILDSIGENILRDGLKETPQRVAKMYYDELCSGYRENPEDVLKTFELETSDSMIIVKNIRFQSLCEHHMIPFIGEISVGYIPGNAGEINRGKYRVLGLSKIIRLIHIFSRRLQVQERLTQQIADTMFSPVLGSQGSMVIVEAEHLCMSCRGVRCPGATTITSAVRGVFERELIVRQEFLTLIK